MIESLFVEFNKIPGKAIGISENQSRSTLE